MTTDALIDGILRREGGWSDRAADRGGPTHRGITLETLAAWRGHPVTVVDLKALSVEETRAIYRARYVSPWEWIPHDALRALLADWAVMTWHDNPARGLQRAVGAVVDGVVGQETRARVLEALEVDPERLYRLVYLERQQDHVQVAFDADVDQFLKTNRSTQLHNLNGWLNRLAEFV